jgi:transposase-like protein
MSKSIELTPELEARIVASIRAGGYAPVAAQAWGVSEALLERWLKRGRRKNAREPYRSFARNVDQALGQARLRAEMEAFKRDPRCWLKHGPGREMPGKPGWTAPARSQGGSANKTVALFANPEVLQLLALVRQVLANYPDALAALDQLAPSAR